jgi:hypothetical protein
MMKKCNLIKSLYHEQKILSSTIKLSDLANTLSSFTLYILSPKLPDYLDRELIYVSPFGVVKDNHSGLNIETQAAFVAVDIDMDSPVACILQYQDPALVSLLIK